MRTSLSACLTLAALAAAGSAAPAAGPAAPLTPEAILARTRILASDDFEGRAPGSTGEEKTVRYLEEEFRRMGLRPGNPDGTYTQAVPLVGITSRPALSVRVGGQALPLEPINDYVAPSSRVVPRVEVRDSGVVFVGYGVVAPEFGWDDYKDVDVRGKTVVMLINDPPVTTAAGQLDPQLFGGAAMTYYGRWSYKYEIAARKGAAACLIVHETGPAAYPFSVVITSRSRENFELRSPDGNAGHIAMEGWLTLDATRRLLTAAGQDFDVLKRKAATRAFRPVDLGAQASFTIENTLRPVDSRNVVALLPGRDPALRDEYVVYTSHWDHLGRDPRARGDQIYNGAADNAGGVAVLLELARAFAALPEERRPRRSLLFLSPTAEEKGLLGARHYARHPLYPLTRTVANLNLDLVNQFGRTTDLQVIGFGTSTLDDIALAVAREQGRQIRPDAHPERGMFYRSDHFEFAKEGVPAFYAKGGSRFVGKDPDLAERRLADYIAKDYHQVSDEVGPDWTFEGAAADAALLLEVGLRVANADRWPEWKPGAEFKARRDESLNRARR